METVYPGIKVHWCSFHVIEAVGRNCRDKDRAIDPKHQAEMTSLFKEAQTAPDKKSSSAAFDKLLNRCKALKEPGMVKYFNSQFGQDKEKWSFAYHSFYNRGSTTNNYSESHMLTLKSNILERMRCYNIVALLDYIVDRLDNVYIHRLEKFSCGEINTRIREINKHIDSISSAAKKIPSRYVIGAPPNVKVRSVATNSLVYNINLTDCSCTCVAGYNGRCCKHLWIASQTFNVPLAFLREYSQSSRFEAAALAFGAASVDLNNYQDIYDGLGGGGGQAPPLPSPNISPIQPPPPYSPNQSLQSPGVAAAARAGPVPPTPNQSARLQALADGIAQEVLRGALLEVGTDGFAIAEADLTKLHDRFSKVKTGGQFMEVSRGLSAVLSAFGGRRSRIPVNNRAVQRRKVKNGSSKPQPRGGVKKPAAAAPNKAKKQLNFSNMG